MVSSKPGVNCKLSYTTFYYNKYLKKKNIMETEYSEIYFPLNFGSFCYKYLHIRYVQYIGYFTPKTNCYYAWVEWGWLGLCFKPYLEMSSNPK